MDEGKTPLIKMVSQNVDSRINSIGLVVDNKEVEIKFHVGIRKANCAPGKSLE